MSTELVSANGYTVIIKQTATVQAAAYATGDLAADKITLTLPFSATDTRFPFGANIQSVVITDLAGNAVAKDVVFFDADPTSTTFTLNSPLDVADTDLVNIIDVVAVDNLVSFVDNSIARVNGLAIPFVVSKGMTAIYAAIIERGAPTYTTASDLTIRVTLMLT